MATEHFSDAELQCNHCHEEEMDEEFLEVLEEIREACGFPLYVTSGYRCPTHNMNVSTTGAAGPHTTGQAVDIMISGENAFKLVSVALALGITGIGINQRGPYAKRFIHIDTLHNEHRPRVWSY